MGNFSRQMRLSSALLKRLQSQRRTVAAVNVSGSRSFTTTEGHRPTIVHKRSLDILHDPWFNKGTAFSMTERDRLDLRGLLPPNVMTSEQQIERFKVQYSGLFRRPRGMYFSAADRGEMMSMVYNWPADQVDMIVVTDGSRILGLGDLGVQGIGIAIGKLDLYVAAAGINPQRVLSYLGLQEHRLDGEEYIAVIDEFMEAVFTRWPHVIVQFEDFQRNSRVALAGLLGAVRAQGRPMIDFPKMKIVVAGAGSAGIGVLNAARKTMARMLGDTEVAFESARSQFWVVDANGLITEARENIDPDARPFARKVKETERQGLTEGAKLVEVVQQVKPDVLLGLSAVGGLFSKEVLEALKGSTSTRPAIFAMSNPTKNGNGHVGHSNQANNMFLFPGIGLGTLLSGSKIVSDGMLQAAAECLAAYMTEEEVLQGIIYPSISRIRDITKEVAAAVITEAIEEDLAEGYREMDARELYKLNQDEIRTYVMNNMWSPEYPTLVYQKD
ncbi:hypothetical protein DH2020_044659 [Rehmannia glutinosa]|uniref:Malic enzyme n=1 Tax=Rehmannia glutinosa TaxID=99300 RepID=A0ABR0UHF3_REHGL